MKVLVADDDLDQLALRCLLLERSGFETVRASDPGAALAMAKAEKPECAVVDVYFPNQESGLRLMRDLKVLNSAIHLFALTGVKSGCLATRSESRLIDEVLEKGSGSANLVRKLKALELRKQMEAQALSPAEELKSAVCDSDASRVREILEHHPELRATIDDPLVNYGFGTHALFAAVQRSDRATIDVLLQAGANINKRTEWWAGGFGVLDDCDPELVPFLTERGAAIDAHAAARLGMTEELREDSDARSRRSPRTGRRRTDSAAFRLDCRNCPAPAGEWRRD